MGLSELQLPTAATAFYHWSFSAGDSHDYLFSGGDVVDRLSPIRTHRFDADVRRLLDACGISDVVAAPARNFSPTLVYYRCATHDGTWCGASPVCSRPAPRGQAVDIMCARRSALSFGRSPLSRTPSDGRLSSDLSCHRRVGCSRPRSATEIERGVACNGQRVLGDGRTSAQRWHHTHSHQ